jgi:guanylate kinase
MQGLLESMLKVWLECGLPPSSFQPKTGKKWWFTINNSVLPAIEAYWARLSYALCEQGLVRGVFEIPYAEVGDRRVIWVADLECTFSERLDPDYVDVRRPSALHPIMIAVGGPSGSGKTTMIRKLQKEMPGQVFTYPAYTTRTKRPNEIDGIDYFFRTSADLELARRDPRYTSFVEARGNWYWINPATLLQGVWKNSDKIHAFFISQRKDILQRRRLFPKLRWIWLDADEEDIRNRLSLRGDKNIDSSIEYNRKLAVEHVEDLLDLRIQTRFGEFDKVVEKIKFYCLNQQGV